MVFCQAEHDGLVRFLSLYCGAALVAEELAHDALIKACREWRKVRQMGNPRAWLRRVAVNLANSHFRRRSAEKRALERLRLGDVSPSVGDPAEAVAIREVLSYLTPRQRSAVLMRYFDDLPVSDIAAALECSENTVKSLLRRGLAVLRSSDTIQGWRELPDV